MKKVLLVLAIFVLLVIQIAIFKSLSIAPLNLLLIFMVVAILVGDFDQGLAVAIISGVFLDFASGLPDGIMTLTCLSVFLILFAILHNLLHREPNRLILVSSVIGGTILYYLLFMFYNQLFGIFNLGQQLNLKYYFNQLILSLVFNFVFAYPVFLFYSYYDKPFRS